MHTAAGDAAALKRTHSDFCTTTWWCRVESRRTPNHSASSTTLHSAQPTVGSITQTTAQLYDYNEAEEVNA